MISLYESAIYFDDVITKIVDICVSRVKDNNFKFNESVNDILVWCDGGEDNVIFIQSKDGSAYATITAQDILDDESDIYEDIKEQLVGTYTDNEDDEFESQ